MAISMQSFPMITYRFLRSKNSRIPRKFKSNIQHEDKKTIADHPVHAPANRGDPWECKLPTPKGYVIAAKAGVFQVYENEAAREAGTPLNYPFLDLETFVYDMNKLCTMIADGPL
ncbi:hypothetical protein AAG570_007726 [Ranatra chinensis]|uniref:Uncharacterized protein n=1 Tax=Ranatra chinensis TaxID=642074 RepID=A0ABD0XUC8_9HEMI